MNIIKALRAVALTAALTLVAGHILAVGYPELLSINSQVGSTASGGNVFGSGSSVTNTPLLLLSTSSQQTYGWVESLEIDSVVGASATAQVLFYDTTSTATCTSATEIDSFLVATGTTRTSIGIGGRIPLDWYVRNNLYVGIGTSNPDTVTASINIGRVKDATLSRP